MHYIYQTEAFVLDDYETGEANKYITFFTQDFGLIKATAQGLREIKSKSRYGLQVFSFCKVFLVKGRNIWRVTGVQSEKNYYSLFSKNKDKLLVVANVFMLLKKLLSGEEKNEKLFEIISIALIFLEEEDLSSEDIDNFENILVIRILFNLGYFSEKNSYSIFLKSIKWEKDLLQKMGEIKKQAISDINEAFQATHLI